MRRIKIAYDIVDEESVQVGDFAETGWIDEKGVEVDPDECDINEADGIEADAIVNLAVEIIQQNGGVEASSSRFHEGVWFTQIDCEMNEQRYSFHLDGFTEEEQRTIYGAVA